MGGRSSLRLVAAAIASAVVLAGCGSRTSGSVSEASGDNPPSSPSASADNTPTPKVGLDAYVAAVQHGMKSQLSPALKKLYSSIRVEPVRPSGIRYVYVFKQPVDPQAGAQQLKTQAPLLDAAFTTQVGPEMKRLGFANPSATWTYLNPDGTQIWTHTAP